MKKKPRRSSEALLAILSHKDLKGTLTYQRILEVLGGRAFGIALLFFSLPSALPVSVVPGISAVFSLPILLFASQMVLGRKTMWLPKFMAERTIQKKTISKVINRTVPYLIKVERLLKPRWIFMTSRFMEIVNGSVIFGLAMLLMLPIPLSNFIFAILLVIFSLGLIEKDGLFITIGYIGVIFYASFIYAFIMAIIKRVIN